MLEKRIITKELIDLPDCQPAIIQKSHQFMRFVNRFLGGTASVKQFIQYAGSKQQRGFPLKILDIGSGSCDIPLSIIKWANSKNINVEFTCVEKDPIAIKSVLENPGYAEMPITVVNTDIFNYHPGQSFDYAVASMFLHHLSADQIVNLTRHLRTFIRKGIFVNDLNRSALVYTSCLLISPFISKEVRHDALISIKKGFKKNDLEKLLTVSDACVAVKKRPWGRITALLEFEGNNEYEYGNTLTCNRDSETLCEKPGSLPIL